MILMDSKGDLIDPIKNLQSIKDRLILIEPNPNPLSPSIRSIFLTPASSRW